MKNKDFQYVKLREQLRRYKTNGTKVLEWRLTYQEIKIIEDIGYRIEPYLYLITTREFFKIGKINNSLIKEIHLKSKEKKHTYIRKLNKKEKSTLDSFGVRYRPIVYKIHLV